jgi:hypothetical protein
MAGFVPVRRGDPRGVAWGGARCRVCTASCEGRIGGGRGTGGRQAPIRVAPERTHCPLRGVHYPLAGVLSCGLLWVFVLRSRGFAGAGDGVRAFVTCQLRGALRESAESVGTRPLYGCRTAKAPLFAGGTEAVQRAPGV